MFDFDSEKLQPDDLGRFAEQAEKAMKRLNETHAKLDEVTGEGADSGKLAKVTADARGRLTELTLNPRIKRLGHDKVAERITTAIREAQDDAERQVSELQAEAMEGMVPPSTKLDSNDLLARFQEIEESSRRSMDEHLRTLDDIWRRLK